MLKEKTLIIHARGGKTGSSALQNFLEKNYKPLAKYGFDYINRLNIESDYIVTSGNGFYFYDVVNNAGDLKSLLLSYFKKNHTAICSCEFIGYLSADHWRQVFSVAAELNIEIKVIYYVRDVSTYLVSAYDQMLKRSGECRLFKEWLGSYGWSHLQCLVNLNSAFSRQALTVRHYDSLRTNIQKDFLKYLDIKDTSAFVHVKSLVVNRSLCEEERALLRLVNKAYCAKFSTELSDLMLETNPLIAKSEIQYSDDELQALNATYTDQVNWVNKLFFTRTLKLKVISSCKQDLDTKTDALIQDVDELVIGWALRKVADIEAQKNAELAQLDAQKNAELAQLDAQKNAELAKLDAQKDAELAQLDAQKNAELAELDAQKNAELAQLDAQKNAELANLAVQKNREVKLAWALAEDAIVNDLKSALLNRKRRNLSFFLPRKFNCYEYLLLNRDVLKERMHPVDHWFLHGKSEKRPFKF